MGGWTCEPVRRPGGTSPAAGGASSRERRPRRLVPWDILARGRGAGSSRDHRPALKLSAAGARGYPLVLIAAVAWLANFLHFTSFGYYEDDWYHFPSAFGQPVADRAAATLALMGQFFQGRPLMVFFEGLFGWLCAAGGAIAPSYLLVYLLLTASAWLFYRLLRSRFPRLFCALAALLFVLSPLTTVRQNLLIGVLTGTALVAVLAALLARRRHPALSYVLAASALLTYESVFMLFLGAPLFERGARRRRLRAWVLHLGVCGVILAAYVAARVAFGEPRMAGVTALPLAAVAGQTVGYMALFSLQSFWSYVYAAKTAALELSAEPVVYIAGFLIWALLLLYRSVRDPSRLGHASGAIEAARVALVLRRGITSGTALLALGYATASFQIDGSLWLPMAGRDTRFSASAVPGSSMIVAALLFTCLCWPRRAVLRQAGRILVTAFLSTLFAYSFVVQYDYQRSWDYQRNFLSQLALLTPDLQQGGLIVVRTVSAAQPGASPKGRVGSVGWQRFGLLVSLKSLGGWQGTPEIVFVTEANWSRNLTLSPDGKLRWVRPPSGSTDPFYLPGRVIVLRESADGALSREDEPVETGGVDIVQRRTSVLNAAAPLAWRAIARSPVLPRILSPAAYAAVRRAAGAGPDQAPGQARPDTKAAGRPRPESPRTLRYHSMVRRSPSSSGVCARKPNSSSARETSSRRRGWPFGFVASQTRRPRNPVSAAIFAAKAAMEISWPLPRLTGCGLSYRSAAAMIPSAASST